MSQLNTDKLIIESEIQSIINRAKTETIKLFEDFDLHGYDLTPENIVKASKLYPGEFLQRWYDAIIRAEADQDSPILNRFNGLSDPAGLFEDVKKWTAKPADESGEKSEKRFTFNDLSDLVDGFGNLLGQINVTTGKSNLTTEITEASRPADDTPADDTPKADNSKKMLVIAAAVVVVLVSAVFIIKSIRS